MIISGAKLAEYYRNKYYSRNSFAAAIGVTEGAVRRWEEGANVKKVHVDKICEVLQIVPADLKLKEVLLVGKGSRKIPVIVLPAKRMEVVDYMVYDFEGVSVIVVADSSMEPLIGNGEHVFISEAKEPESGMIALIEVEGQLYLRECRLFDGKFIYIALNPEKENFKEAKIIGEAISRTVSL
ncbi:hypothetical protein V511_12220 [Mesotoga sp. Brook.08.YT.4.2.5.1]|uniref:XRE family transcriptional regulator n=1 Tax=unclassified Mesotoga TaxID=1184398 RepID=UPI000C19D79D|nr:MULTISPECIES: S24 family peptidase [unclassified Mesotoga]PNE19883.1 hypothetical protein V511_12220 [Mesotoga sp. Brook.08.YT.4.2.5.1]PVD18218.1 hypothetical protein V512_015235 [Mesotoga sp. Brook.08.105.5.1]RAO96549.1 hypothetical protein M388_14215 [Mesotoga sp. Brook.08.YT.4.2.5.4.]RDI93696.1 hypothetical protein Q502_04400 [Mesotoga sp. Brook.08.YT.4.2.5.2.]